MTVVQPGSRFGFPARLFNDIQEVVRQWRAGLLSARPGGVAAAGGMSIRNDSGSDLSRFSVLGIDGVVFAHADNANEFQNNPTLKGSSPTFASDHVGRFAVLLEPAKDGKVARCITSGLVSVQVNITDADHEWCDVAASDTAKLTSYGAGSAQIVHKPAGTGTKWCIVNLGQSYGPAREYTGLINDAGGFLTTDGTTAMDTLKAVDGVPVETSLATVYNVNGWPGDDNADARARWNAEQKRWELVMVDCI